MIESAAEFIRLRTSENLDDYHQAATDSAPNDVWYELVGEHPEMKFWVAQNKTVPVDILEILSTDADPKVRWMVASKNRLPQHLQLRLANDDDESVRHRIACNKKAIESVLQVLAVDESELVRLKAIDRLRSANHKRD